ncbi:Clp protease proteolytic subunit ClpP [Defluviimonas sp. 20V17]|uniref:ATP-dependent Clp protease proteolytic subunit n=1 Tax=Allgaiera indica TaxID=765699 RepID=A0AAN4UR98_9RHOB|nr:ATP-dependent Clp protease proteolytic subunit [Allgaiera indica]KDB02727.1 Clp protease proteolytic subunit ClpP [Defluviimonas sp. 20V17]GHE01728.1 ATP-dependent Clp protease proteolytic subunit 3 [Allgaiera indica]SDW94383.1 ATP-dependent Clp protease proteolytic subunit ClpP [Allgaiera indica]
MAETKDDKDDKTKSPQVEQLFFKSRSVIVAGEINDKLASRVTQQLLALAQDGDEPINMYISSPGGHVESGDMVHDMIKFIRPKVRTIGSGWVASAGALIFVGADRADRYCLPNTRFLLHQPSGGIGGKVSDMQIQAEQIRIMRERFDKLFAEATGQTPEKISQDTQRDFWLTAKEAIDYGLCGKIIETMDDLA